MIWQTKLRNKIHFSVSELYLVQQWMLLHQILSALHHTNTSDNKRTKRPHCNISWRQVPRKKRSKEVSKGKTKTLQNITFMQSMMQEVEHQGLEEDAGQLITSWWAMQYFSFLTFWHEPCPAVNRRKRKHIHGCISRPSITHKNQAASTGRSPPVLIVLTATDLPLTHYGIRLNVLTTAPPERQSF